MKKINRLFNIATIYVVSILAIAITMTFISDYLTSINWFGDIVTNKKILGYAFASKDGYYVQWGARHYWYNWGCSYYSVYQQSG